MQLLWAELQLPKDKPFCIKNIPQSAKLLSHLSGSHLATHKLHYSFLLYLAPSSCIFSSLDERFCLQTLKSLFYFSLTIQFHFFCFFGGQTCHSRLPIAIVCRLLTEPFFCRWSGKNQNQEQNFFQRRCIASRSVLLFLYRPCYLHFLSDDSAIRTYWVVFWQPLSLV